MTFNYSAINFKHSIKVGLDTAPIKIVEYINLRCPDSKAYEEKITPYLNTFIQEGKVQRIIKHFDKESYGLEKGNLLNQYLNYDTPSETYEMIQKLFNEQEQWGHNRISQMPHIAKKYGLALQKENIAIAKNVFKETQDVHVEMIPTVFVNEKYFVETIDFDAFKKAIEAHL